MKKYKIVTLLGFVLGASACGEPASVVITGASTHKMPFEEQPVTLALFAQNLQPGARLFFNNTFQVPNVQVSDDLSTIQLTTLKNPTLCGPITVTIKNLDGGSGTDANLLSYYTRTVAFGTPTTASTSLPPNAIPLLGTWVVPGQVDLLLLVPRMDKFQTDVWWVQKPGTSEQQLIPWPALPHRVKEDAVVITPPEPNGLSGLAALTLNPMEADFKILRFYQLSSDFHTFSEAKAYSSATPLTALTVGDWNEDGVTDAMVTTGTSFQQLVFDNAAKVFVSTSVPAIMATTTLRMVTGDIDQDGKPDVMYYEPGTNEIRRLRNNGGNTWTDGTLATAPLKLTGVAVADANGDGPIDLLVFSERQPMVTWMLQKPGSVFSADAGHVGVLGSTKTALGDVTQDRKPDVVLWSDTTKSLTVLGSQCPPL